jgi:hypothetical protein
MRCNFRSSASNWQDKLVVLSTLSKGNALQVRLRLECSSNVTIVNTLLTLKTNHFCALISITMMTTLLNHQSLLSCCSLKILTYLPEHSHKNCVKQNHDSHIYSPSTTLTPSKHTKSLILTPTRLNKTSHTLINHAISPSTGFAIVYTFKSHLHSDMDYQYL